MFAISVSSWSVQGGPQNISCLFLLLAPQSGAHRRGAYRDFQTILSTFIYGHLSLYIYRSIKASQWQLWQSVVVCGTSVEPYLMVVVVVVVVVVVL